MTRGTFANIRIKNQMLGGKEGGFTLKFPEGQEMPIFDAAMKYREEGVPLVVIAGKEYGTGSSRDWAAKGTLLLGVKAVLAETFERIHRSNLVGMGILPLVFQPGQTAESLAMLDRLIPELRRGEIADIRALLPRALATRGEAQFRAGQPGEAEASIRESIALLGAPAHDNGQVLCNAMLALAQGLCEVPARREQALQAAREAVELADRWAEKNPTLRVTALNTLGRVHPGARPTARSRPIRGRSGWRPRTRASRRRRPPRSGSRWRRRCATPGAPTRPSRTRWPPCRPVARSTPARCASPRRWT